MINRSNPETFIQVPYYRTKGERAVCGICPRECKLKPGQRGYCRGRENIDGRLYAVNYGRTASAAVDPIEKKPLYHFHPGSQILSIGPNSCNLSCKFCQNSEISQFTVPTEKVNPRSLADIAEERNSIGVAYTYTEPFMWYEFLLDCCAEFRKRGMLNVLVTNGYVNPEPFAKLAPLIDAMNIDLKSMDESFYYKLCGGVHLKPVLKTIETAYEAGIHIELTQLLISGANDHPEQIARTVDWIAGIGREIPLHFSRYFPRHKYRAPATKPDTLKSAYDIAAAKLDWVYVGNISLDVGSHSLCPDCKALLVERRGYSTMIENLDGEKCGNCGRKVYFRN